MSTGLTPTQIKQQAIDIATFIQDNYISELQRLIQNRHIFVAFLVISSGIEFLGKAISNHGWFKKGMSKKDFNYALAVFQSLKKYSNLGIKYDSSQNDESFYAIVRCGIVHASRPLQGISLSDTNNLLPNEIGIIDLSTDFFTACNDLLNSTVPMGKGKNLNDIICYY